MQTRMPTFARRLAFAAKRTFAAAPILALWLMCLGCYAMNPPREVVYRVNSFRVPCVGVAPMSCLQVQREGDASASDWQLFYASIDGFDYEPGYLYRLLVRETTLPPEQVPADASSIRYELVEMLAKEQDSRFAIHDIWMLERIDGEALASFDPASRVEHPYIEINVTRGDYLGHDGCHAIRGDLEEVGFEQQLRLGHAAVADSARTCGDGVLQTRMPAALDRVVSWERDGLWLRLLDEDSMELLAFHKTD